MDTIEFKGIRQGILATIPEEEKWAAVCADLSARIDSQKEFFKGASVVLQVHQRGLRRNDLESLITLLDNRGVKLVGVLSGSATTQDTTRKMNLATDLNDIEIPVTPSRPAPVPQPEPISPVSNAAANAAVGGSEGVLIRRTLRGGNTIQHAGHVVVLGDVNAGAEIVAGGDVVVWGHLRGVVHAGASGNLEAVVCALNLEPTQLRIGNLISVSPPRRRRKPQPERAYVEGGQIHAEEWKP